MSPADRGRINGGLHIEERFREIQLLRGRAGATAQAVRPEQHVDCDPDAAGITEMRRIAALADVNGVLWPPHNSTGTAPYVPASIDLAAATPNFDIMKGGNIFTAPYGNALLKEPFKWTPGYARVPERPRPGVEFNEAVLAKVQIG